MEFGNLAVFGGAQIKKCDDSDVVNNLYARWGGSLVPVFVAFLAAVQRYRTRREQLALV